MRSIKLIVLLLLAFQYWVSGQDSIYNCSNKLKTYTETVYSNPYTFDVIFTPTLLVNKSGYTVKVSASQFDTTAGDIRRSMDRKPYVFYMNGRSQYGVTYYKDSCAAKQAYANYIYQRYVWRN